MARKKKKSRRSSLPKWTFPLFVVLALLLTVLTFSGEELGFDASFLETCMNAVDRILYGGPTGPDPSLPTTGEAKVYVIDVGQGESILITTPETSMLIDAGENDKGDEVLDFIDALGLDKIDYALATHPHSDHIGGLDTVLDNIEVGEVLFGEVPDEIIPTTKTYADVLDAIERNNVPLSLALPGDEYDLGCGAVVTVLGPISQEVTQLNNTSVVCRLDFGETSFLFNGDQEAPMERLLVEHRAALDCDVMTMGHHGSSTSSTQEYVEAVSPQYATISCGKGNKYGHPNREVLELLEEEHIEYYRTDLSGNITFSSNGKKITVRTQKP